MTIPGSVGSAPSGTSAPVDEPEQEAKPRYTVGKFVHSLSYYFYV